MSDYAGVRLSPPQYTLWRKLANSIGAHPYISVDEPYPMGERWYIDVCVGRPKTAVALAQVLLTDYDFGGIKVTIRVLDRAEPIILSAISSEGKNATAIQEMLVEALRDNRYYVTTLKPQEQPPLIPWGEIVIVFKPEVIQFWNDNLADYYGYNHYVAQDVFAEVLKLEYEDGTRVSVTTKTSLLA